MTDDLRQYIFELAEKYNVEEFVANDPVQFPRRYRRKQDIEVSAMITQWISYGNRKAIIEKGNQLDVLFNGAPFDFLMSKAWQIYEANDDSLYRFYKWRDFYALCRRLYELYQVRDSLECLISEDGDYADELCRHFVGVNGIPDPKSGSAVKRIWMMLRWLIRQDGKVDIGIWKRLKQERLLVPVDVHVLHEAQKLGITKRKSASIVVAKEITQFMKQVFPDDPAKGDFALFGLGVDNDK